MKSKVALVTGASSGIGAATAERLVAAGYKVFGTSRRAAPAGQRSFEMLTLDVTSDRPVEAAVAEVMRSTGTTAGGHARRLRFLHTFLPAGLMDAGFEGT